MTISKEEIQANNFVKGIITEASPLTFPPNASLDEINFKLNRDGTRDRRLGIDFEDGYVLHSTGYTTDQLNSSTRSFYRWPNPNGSKVIDIGIIQIGGYIFFCNLLAESPSAALLNGGVPINTGCPNTALFEYATIGQYLIAVSSDLTQPYLVSYREATDTIVLETSNIKIRDTVGVFDNLAVDARPITLSPEHRYNLVNQGWLPTGIVSTCGDAISPTDCTFQTFGVYPSNADQWSIGRIENQADPDIKKYDPNLAARYLINAGQVPRGHFIIDAFDRGTSRKNASGITGLPLDRETGRVRTVASYAGRAWYAGILSNIIDGDERSPTINGVIYFSQVLQSPIDLVKCYTEADPTSPEFNDILDTDGGDIRILEATVIVKLIPIKSSLFVFAENGIWEIRGDDSGFRAANWQVNKITSTGVSSYRSIVEVNGQLFFWANDGIYTLIPNDQGLYDTKSITKDTIQKLYNSLPNSARRTAKGYYDAANNKLRWLYYSEEASYTGTPQPLPGGGVVPVPFDLQALLDAGVTNILAGIGSNYRLNVDATNAFISLQHKDAVYNGSAVAAGGIRPALGISSAGIAMGYNDNAGAWHNAVAIEASGNATFAGTVAANSILTNSIILGGSAWTIADVITTLDAGPATFDLQANLDAGVGYIKAGVGGNYQMIVDDTLHYVSFKHKDAVFEGVATPAAGLTALGISANGIAMGYNDPTTGAWVNAVAITSAGDASFKGTISAGSVLTNTLAISGTGQTLQDMIDDIATFSGGSFNLQPALDAGVTNILAGTGADYRLTVNTSTGFVAFHHKDAVYNGTAVTGSGIRPAIGLSAAGIGMGYNAASGGGWVNAISISATGDALFAGTIAANSIIVNSATIDGVTVGTIAGRATAGNAHSLLTGNVHNVALAQITGDLDDITDGATYFRTNATQVTGATRASNALDSASDYIRSIQSTKIVVSGANPTTGWVADGAGIRLYQSGVLKTNLPVSGAPSFSGDITGGANINITGQGLFGGAFVSGGYNAALHSNPTFSASYGLVARSDTANAAGVFGMAFGSSGTCSAIKGEAILSNVGVQAKNLNSAGTALQVLGKMTISDTTLVTNLNADMVDGYHSTSLLRTISPNTGSCSVINSNITMGSTVSGIRTRGDGFSGLIIESFSDRNLKKEIEPEVLGLDFINKLKPSTFRLKDSPKIKYHGFIAQDLEELVTDSDALYQEHDDGVKGTDYMSLIAPLVKAVQELTKEIEILKGKV